MGKANYSDTSARQCNQSGKGIPTPEESGRNALWATGTQHALNVVAGKRRMNPRDNKIVLAT